MNSDVDEGNFVISKMGLKGAHFKHVHIKKCREDSMMEKLRISVKSARLGASPKHPQLCRGRPGGPGGHQVVHVALMVKKVSSLLG